MKKLFLLSICFLLLFIVKSNAQTLTTYTNMPDGQMYGTATFGGSDPTVSETDDVWASPPSGMSTVSTYMIVWAEGNLGDEVYLVNDYENGPHSGGTWDPSSLATLYPGELFELHYSWECEYTDGVNIYLCDWAVDY